MWHSRASLLVRASLLFFLLALYGFSKARFGLSVPANGCINIPFSDRTPTIDGLWTSPSEWSGATLIELSNGVNETANVWLEYNGTYVFVLIDFLTDVVHNTYDQGGVCIDAANDGGSLPQPDDYLFSILAGQSPTFVYTFEGIGNGSKPEDAWSLTVVPEADGQAGFAKGQYGNDSIHLIYEWQIPCTLWPATSSYGFYVYVFDYHSSTFLEWPVGAGGGWRRVAEGAPQYVPPSPEHWGSIEGDFVPEFHFQPLFIGVAAALTGVGVLVRKAKLRKPSWGVSTAWRSFFLLL